MSMYSIPASGGRASPATYGTSTQTPARSLYATISAGGSGRVVGASNLSQGTVRASTLGTVSTGQRAAPVTLTSAGGIGSGSIGGFAARGSARAPIVTTSARSNVGGYMQAPLRSFATSPRGIYDTLGGTYDTLGGSINGPIVTRNALGGSVNGPIVTTNGLNTAFVSTGTSFVSTGGTAAFQTIVGSTAFQTMPQTVAAADMPADDELMVLSYWPLFAKGVAPAIALTIGNMPWMLGPAPGSQNTGNLWAEWLEMKPNTPWGFLPNLEIAGGEKIGSELAILQYLARRSPALQGATDKDFRTSQELLHQAEELYQKLAKSCFTIMDQDKDIKDFEAFWTGVDRNSHSSKQGLPVYLTQFEEFYATVGGNAGQFTSAGTTIGEIKLYSVLTILILMDNTLLNNYPCLLEFYMKWENNPPIKEMLDAAMSQWNWQQYFILPP